MSSRAPFPHRSPYVKLSVFRSCLKNPRAAAFKRVAWSPDGRRLALSLGWGFELVVLDSSTWREATRIKWKTFQPERDIAFLSNTEIVTQSAENVTNSPMALAIYDSETGRSIREIPRPLQYARKLTDAVTTTLDGQFIATVEGLLNTALFEAKTGRFIGPVSAPTDTATMSIAGGPDGKLAMNVTYRGQRAVSDIRDELYVVDTASNSVDRVIRGHRPGIKSIAWSHNGRMIASGGLHASPNR